MPTVNPLFPAESTRFVTWWDQPDDDVPMMMGQVCIRFLFELLDDDDWTPPSVGGYHWTGDPPHQCVISEALWLVQGDITCVNPDHSHVPGTPTYCIYTSRRQPF